jgi:serine/threonine-protein kinase
VKSRFDKARWEALSPLIDELLPLDAATRGERIARLRRDNGALADDLLDLLGQYTAIEHEHFLEGALLRPAPDASLEGQIIGSYTLDRLIGQGGMGAVWLAHRSDGRYDARVAIKLLNPALLGPGGIERFRREAQALGRLAHDHIARLVDAGVTPGGQPYLVLDYVEGEAINRWCEQRALDVRARVRLFLDVLAAVAHAHAKLILHRDLKPSNILVTDEGQVKLVDFGIAKLLDDGGEGTPVVELTQVGGAAFTPEYAAPEQVQGGDLTSATDVYALGVLLYVLLTGKHPTLGGETTPLERLRAIVDTEPTRPSDTTRVDAATGAASALPPPHRRALQGDLDNIVLKALKKSPAERYHTVDAFADDLRRYLSDEPVSARADSLAYRTTKFVARNKLAVGAAVIVFLTIVAAAVISTWQAIEATRQRDRALALVSRNDAVVGFLTSMLTEVAPADQPVKVADLIERSQQMLLSESDIPEHRAAILHMLSAYYLSSGKPAQADELLATSIELTKDTDDQELRAMLQCESAYAASLLGRIDEAKERIAKGLEDSRGTLSAAIQCHRNRAYIAQNTNDPQTALDYALKAQALVRASPVPKPDTEAEILADIAAASYMAGRNDDAERYYGQALDKLTTLGRAESPNVLFLRNNWGLASFATGDPARALEQYDAALHIAVERSVGGEPPPYLLHNRASALAALARYPEAIEAYDAAIDSATRAGNANVRVGGLANRGITYLMMGDVARAEQELAAIGPEIGNSVSADSVPALAFMQLQARVDAEHGRFPEAIAGLTKVVEFYDGRGMKVAAVVRTLHVRSDVYLRAEDLDKAMADATRSLEVARGLQGGKSYSSLTGQSLLLIARIQAARGDGGTAQKTAGEAMPHLVQTLGDAHPDTRRAQELAPATAMSSSRSSDSSG